MSLYNMVYGANPATFFILPMFGKHPNSYPRFRDCFIGELKNSDQCDQFGIPIKKTSDEKVVSIYTRVGGGNREDYRNAITELRNHPNYMNDYDDDFDSTYATFVFSIPEEWKKDFDLITGGRLLEISPEYKARLYEVFPKLTEKFDEMFKTETNDTK